MMNRREFLAGLAALLVAPVRARAASLDSLDAVRLAATWQVEHGYQVGVLSHAASGEGALKVAAALDVPNRAHGLLREPGGSLLAVARRPGDWLLRWDQEGRAIAWRWIEPRRAFAGHVLASANGRILYTTETDLDSGAGMIGVRDVRSLEKLNEWPTHGIDPHQLLWDATAGEGKRLIVANGGVPTQPETGRVKRGLERMDSSLVRLDAETGELLGQWHLTDRRLSLRHLAWNTASANRATLGIALQAEHDTTEEKANAPVLALFDGHILRTVPAPQALAGYGGDIAALGGHFAVSCPRTQGVALFSVDGNWHGMAPLSDACALASTSQQLWAGGRLQALGLHPMAVASDQSMAQTMSAEMPGLRLDNHWIVL
jgi:uncharacterized protein